MTTKTDVAEMLHKRRQVRRLCLACGRCQRELDLRHQYGRRSWLPQWRFGLSMCSIINGLCQGQE